MLSSTHNSSLLNIDLYDIGALSYNQLLLPDSVQTTSGTVNHNHSESSNHDSHYYHILEPSQDYNLNWLASDTEDRELLLQSWREGIILHI